jgi:hypothetical protein
MALVDRNQNRVLTTLPLASGGTKFPHIDCLVLNKATRCKGVVEEGPT